MKTVCHNLQGCDGWCIPPDRSLVPVSYTWVNARGSQIGTTQTFITAVYCEMLRAYTVRSWSFFLFVFNRNPWMHLACSLSAVLTILITIIPGIRNLFGLTPISWWYVDIQNPFRAFYTLSLFHAGNMHFPLAGLF